MFQIDALLVNPLRAGMRTLKNMPDQFVNTVDGVMDGTVFLYWQFFFYKVLLSKVVSDCEKSNLGPNYKAGTFLL